jgi:putative ABC transport system ATP-binding protein
MRNALELKRVSKIYNGAPAVTALHDVSLELAPGMFCLVQGASGSGKTTLLGIAGGLEEPTLGRVFVSGTQISGLGAGELAAFRRGRVGFIFQDFKLIAALTAEENVELPVRFRGENRRSARARSRALLERLGLGQRLSQRPATLSGGEKQRVAIARALIHSPSLVLADEPTANLDSVTGQEVIALLRDAVANTDTTVLVATHDPRLSPCADRVIRLTDGRLVEDDFADERLVEGGGWR